MPSVYFYTANVKCVICQIINAQNVNYTINKEVLFNQTLLLPNLDH